MLELDTKFYDGFGGWVVTKNGEEFYRDTSDDWDNVKDVSDIEEMIGEDEESEYLAILWSPLRGATYQRHSKNHWALIEQNEGFA